MIKIGCTLRDSRARARELYSTGVPTPFEVAFEVFSENHAQLEAQAKDRLADFRVNRNREFFRYPLKDAIDLLLQLNREFTLSEQSFSAISILARMKQKYPAWIDPEIVDVQIVQTDKRVWLEITKEEERAGYLKDQTLKRSDLAFICGDGYESMFFGFDDPATENARKFVEEFDPYSIIMTTDLFHEAACHEVNEKFNPHRGRQELK